MDWLIAVLFPSARLIISDQFLLFSLLLLLLPLDRVWRVRIQQAGQAIHLIYVIYRKYVCGQVRPISLCYDARHTSDECMHQTKLVGDDAEEEGRVTVPHFACTASFCFGLFHRWDSLHAKQRGNCK